jgi:large subunit ribosomal protein L17
MRHRKHNHQLGVKTAHRASMLANLCCSLIESGRIKTTLARARALRPTIEKIITLAKKAHLAQDTAKKIHYRRLAMSRLRSKSATQKLFDELVEQFLNRQGGYTCIYKLALPRLGDASEMALIEFVAEPESKKKKKSKKTAKKTEKTPTENVDVTVDEKEDSENTSEATKEDPSIVATSESVEETESQDILDQTNSETKDSTESKKAEDVSEEKETSGDTETKEQDSAPEAIAESSNKKPEETSDSEEASK